MVTNEIRKLIHDLVDKSDNEYLLEFVSYLLLDASKNKEMLTNEQQEMILKAFDESELSENLLSHDKALSLIKNEL